MKLIEHLARKYDPSLSGAIGMVGGMIVLGAVAAVPVAALIGAGAASFAGVSILTGALWGGGLVAGGAAVLVSAIVLPQVIYTQCYKHMLRKHVAAGGSTSGMKWVHGIDKLRSAVPTTNKPRWLISIGGAFTSKAQPGKAGEESEAPAPPRRFPPGNNGPQP